MRVHNYLSVWIKLPPSEQTEISPSRCRIFAEKNSMQICFSAHSSSSLRQAHPSVVFWAELKETPPTQTQLILVCLLLPPAASSRSVVVIALA